MNTKKITSDDILDWEKASLIDAIGNCIELNDYFLESCASPEFAKILKRIPEKDREGILSSLQYTSFWNHTPASCDNDLIIDISEIEFQFEGDPKDVFDDMDDFVIRGDLAYLYVGYGLSINYDRRGLLEAVEYYLSTD